MSGPKNMRKQGTSHSSYKCPHCGKFSAPSGAGLGEAQDAVNAGEADDDDTGQYPAVKANPTQRARGAVKKKLAEYAQRDDDDGDGY